MTARPNNVDGLGLVDALRLLADAETRLLRLRERLVQLAAQGRLRREDVHAYDALRRKLYVIESSLRARVVFALRFAAERFGLERYVDQIPEVTMLPPLPVRATDLPQAGKTYSLLLGSPVAAGGVVITGWAALFLGLAIVGAIASVVAAGAYIAAAIIQQLSNLSVLEAYYDELEETYERCVERGGTDCNRIYQELPSPQAILPRLPDPPDPTAPFRWGVAVLGIVGAVTLGVWVWSRQR